MDISSFTQRHFNKKKVDTDPIGMVHFLAKMNLNLHLKDQDILDLLIFKEAAQNHVN